MDASFKAQRDAALEKVRKLLAIANDARGNENECANAARMADSIMRKWQIDNADVIMEELNSAESFAEGFCPVNPDERGGHKFKEVPSWTSTIALVCAQMHDCIAHIINTPQGKKIRFQGFATDVEVCGWVYSFLIREIWRLSKAYGGTRAEQSSFRNGGSPGYTSGYGKLWRPGMPKSSKPKAQVRPLWCLKPRSKK